MKPEESYQSDEDMQMATGALIRASKRARQLAQQTGTELVIVRDGRLVREIPQPPAQKLSQENEENAASASEE